MRYLAVIDLHGDRGYYRRMQRVARLLLDMVSAGVITDYAVFGAVAQMRYTEAVSTMDADILIGLSERPGLDILKPIYDYCVSKGYSPEGEAVRVGDWPVQFIPAFSPLTAEAMREAEIVEIEGVPLRVVSANYLALIALSTGRPKDYARVLALVESGSVSLDGLVHLAKQHGLSGHLQRFIARFQE